MFAGDALDHYFKAGGPDEYRSIVEMNQLPAYVPTTYIPGGLPPPNDELMHLGVQVAPKADGGWKGRKWTWTVHEFNDKSTDETIFLAIPGAKCSIKTSVQTRWQNNYRDYAHHLNIELHYGIRRIFDETIIQNGIFDDAAESRAEFVAPTKPGLYYIIAAAKC